MCGLFAERIVLTQETSCCSRMGVKICSSTEGLETAWAVIVREGVDSVDVLSLPRRLAAPVAEDE